MTAGGWVMLIIIWGFIISLTVFCMRTVLRLRDVEMDHIKPMLEIDTGDLDEQDKEKEE